MWGAGRRNHLSAAHYPAMGCGYERLRLESQLTYLALHKLKMDVERVKWVAYLMCNAGRQQCQRLHSFTLDRGKGLGAGFSGIMNDQRYARAARFLAVEGRGIDAQEP